MGYIGIDKGGQIHFYVDFLSALILYDILQTYLLKCTEGYIGKNFIMIILGIRYNMVIIFIY